MQFAVRVSFRSLICVLRKQRERKVHGWNNQLHTPAMLSSQFQQLIIFVLGVLKALLMLLLACNLIFLQSSRFSSPLKGAGTHVCATAMKANTLAVFGVEKRESSGIKERREPRPHFADSSGFLILAAFLRNQRRTTTLVFFIYIKDVF
jgi:hypothetical protein